MSTTLIAALLVLSAVAELFGTVTVAVNYYCGTALARSIETELAVEDAREKAKTPMDDLLDQMAFAHPYNVQQADARLRAFRRRVAFYLTARKVLWAGLTAYVAGALLGLAAGLVALYR